MKKTLIISALIAVACTGCAVGQTSWNGYPTVFPGMIYTDLKTPTHINQDETPVRQMEFVKNVKCETKSVAILGIISTGGNTLEEIKEKMLKDVDADDVIDISVDAENLNLLCLINTVEATYMGKAVKYKK